CCPSFLSYCQRYQSNRPSFPTRRSSDLVETAQSDVQSAEAALDEARARFERQRELQRQGAISAQELETVRSAYLQAQAAREAALDRKSTRLNSSHVKISYAVFCLKKKTV